MFFHIPIHSNTLLFLFFYDADEFYRGFSFLACGMTISLIIFTIFPTTFCHRPEVLTGNAFEQFWLRFIYGADKPTNVFPSIHVYNSLAVHIALAKCKALKNKPAVRYASLVLCILICMSTIFLKQHSVLDVIGGFALMAVMYVFIYVIDYKKIIKR